MREMTPEWLAEKRRIAEAATPGPLTMHLCGDPRYAAFVEAPHLGPDAPELAVFLIERDARFFAEFDRDTVLALLDEIERLWRVVDQVEWVEPPDAHPDLGRWCPMCRSWEAYGHELRCPYYGGLVNGIFADAQEKAAIDPGEYGIDEPVVDWNRTAELRAQEIDRLRRERETLAEALRELVTLKDHLKHADPAEYERRKPAAWEMARTALALLDGEKGGDRRE